MIASLQTCLPGPLESWRSVCCLQASDRSVRSISGADLLAAGSMQALIARFAARHPGGDARAIVSMWTHWYFGALIVPATAALIVLDRALPVTLDEVRLIFDDEGKIQRILLRNDGDPSPAGDRFTSLIDGHIAPVIHHLTATFSVSPRLLWTSAAAILDWSLAQIAVTERGDIARRDAHRRLTEPLDPVGNRNPMAGSLRLIAEGVTKTCQRRTCCLRYLLPGVACCGAVCPRPEARHGLA